MISKAEFLAEQGASLRRQRAELELTRAQIADGLGVAEASVALWENGRSVMSAYNAMLLRFFFKRQWHERGKRLKAEFEARQERAQA